MAAMALLGHLDADSRVNQRDLGALGYPVTSKKAHGVCLKSMGKAHGWHVPKPLEFLSFFLPHLF